MLFNPRRWWPQVQKRRLPLTYAPLLTLPTSVATGNTTATCGATTNGASGTMYFLRRTGATPATGPTIVATGNSLAISSSGANTLAMTAFTTNFAYVVDIVHDIGGALSNVVSTPSFTPSTLSFGGTVGTQTGVSGSAFGWVGSSPSAIVSGGIGAKTWTGSGLGSSGLTVNASTGQLQGTCGTAGTYSVTLTCTDSSTAGTNPSGGGSPPQTVATNTFVLTVSATGSPPTVTLDPSNLTVTTGSTASFTASFAGSPAPSLQWQEFISGSWTAMSGQTGNVLSLGIVLIGDNGRSFRLGGTNASGGPIYTAAATLTVTASAVGTITSDVLAGWGDDTPIASTTIQFVTVERVSNAAIALQLTNQVTNTAGRLIITNAAIAPGVEYMLAIRNAAGTIRGYKKYTAS